jgi:SAM-dependent methyltransferase
VETGLPSGSQAPPDADALVQLGRALAAAGYRFVTVTPATHQRVDARAAGPGHTLRDIFGWSRPFAQGTLPAPLTELLAAAGALRPQGDLYRSAVRFSSVGDHLYVHSAHPVMDADPVRFGPDTYRFISLVRAEIAGADRLVDIGCGTGAAGLELLRANICWDLVLADVNPRALAMARVNTTLADQPAVQLAESDGLAAVEGPFDCVIASPPYLGDDPAIDLSVRITREALQRLAPGGTLVLYTGTPIIEGQDPLRQALVPVLEAHRAPFRYFEIDPDVCGEELERPAYRQADRLAAIGLVARLPL